MIHRDDRCPWFNPKRHPGDYWLVQHVECGAVARFAHMEWCDTPPPQWELVRGSIAERGEKDGILRPEFWALPIVFPAYGACNLCREQMCTHRVKDTATTSVHEYIYVCDKHASYYMSQDMHVEPLPEPTEARWLMPDEGK